MVCRILVADDSATIQKVIRIGLAAIQSDIKSAGSLVEATKAIEQGAFDLIIADAGLPGVSTAGDFIKLIERAGNLPLIILMGSYEAVREADLRAVGITHIIKKPFPPSELPQIVQTLTGAPKAQQPAAVAAPVTPRPGIPNIPAAPLESGLPAFSLDTESSVASDATTIRSSIPMTDLPSFTLGDGPSLVGFPPVPEVEPSRKGRPAFDAGSAEPSGSRATPNQAFNVTGSQSSPPSAEPFNAPSMSSASISRAPQPPGVSPPHTNAGLSAAVEAFVRDELPALVDRAVERYCVENFKGVARDVLTAELRRLAEEKARYLVDQ